MIFKKSLWLFVIGLLLISIPARASEDEILGEDFDDEKPGASDHAKFDEDDSATIEDEPAVPLEDEKFEPVDFKTPDPKGPYHFADAFKTKDGIGKHWFKSEAKKEGVEEDLAKYNGEWEIGEAESPVLQNDYALILKTKARHHAIAAKLIKPFRFADGKPLIVQYDAKFQNGQECGGGYIKLLSEESDLALTSFHDKTPYTIMFGPDKCGLTSKLHFIIRYKNPLTGEVKEHHAKQPSKTIDDRINDKKSHVYTLILKPDNSYQVLVDQKQVSKGSLLDTMEPAIQPEKEINDPNEKKPEDWDDREKIPDADAKKPDDWDEEAPEYIDDPNAKKPEGWLDSEEEYIPDDKAIKPEDWDESMDGKWEPPLVKNPKCETAAGCGAWVAPRIKNPAYKGKWSAPMIKNVNYKGKWTPKKIPNPAFFEAKDAFAHLQPIAAIGLELWSMSDNIMFDDFIITDDQNTADVFAHETWYLKSIQENRKQRKESFFGGIIEAANERPWLWAVYLLVLLIPIVLIVVYCCRGGAKDEVGAGKKTDAPTADDDEGAEVDAEEDAEDSDHHQQQRDESPAKNSGGGADSPANAAKLRHRKASKSPARTKADLEESDSEEENEKTPAGNQGTKSPKKNRPRRD